MTYFECKALNAYYGESWIVQNVSFEVNEGEVVALLGRNGAGKTSTLKAIACAIEPTVESGEIYLQGQAVHKMQDFEAARHGIQYVPEDRRIIPGLSVEENLTLAQVAPDLGWPLEQVYERFPRLAERRTQEGITLSGGEQQMLAVARALMRNIKLLLLDEPYEGLAPTVVREIEKIVHQIKDEGITTIIVEQNAIAALELADRALIMDTGELAYSGTAKDVLNTPELLQKYLAI